MVVSLIGRVGLQRFTEMIPWNLEVTARLPDPAFLETRQRRGDDPSRRSSDSSAVVYGIVDGGTLRKSAGVFANPLSMTSQLFELIGIECAPVMQQAHILMKFLVI